MILNESVCMQTGILTCVKLQREFAPYPVFHGTGFASRVAHGESETLHEQPIRSFSTDETHTRKEYKT